MEIKEKMKKNIFRKKGRKGQFYIFGAIVLCIMAYSIYAGQSRIQLSTKNEFRNLYTEFLRESGSAIDSAIYNEQSLSERMENFTDAFLPYARTKEKTFGAFYALISNSTIFLRNNISISAVNSANRNITASLKNSTDEWQISIDEESSFNENGIERIRIFLDGMPYDFSIYGREIELKAIFYSQQRNGTSIYSYDG
ncbi:MAG: hypothetical protein NTV63_03450 [Candidatus Woesearchaeota archaeon]|nr:hypothetical protein [Candidatus Woesearchaeota archaeon]